MKGVIQLTIHNRCTKCNLPDSYPGLTFNDKGECNFCQNYTNADDTYLGEDKLREKVNEILSRPENKNREYDAVVAYSGGRDSTYLIHFLKNTLKLNVLALSLTHDFIPNETNDSKYRICKELGVDLKCIENDVLNTYSRKLVRAWSKDVNAPMLITFCTGCRYGIKKIIPDYCRKHNIPLLFVGDNRMENMTYRQDLLSSNSQNPSTLNKIKGYAGHVLKNPKLISSPGCLAMQGYEFVLPKLKQKEYPIIIAPMRDYFYVPEDKLIETICSLGWFHDQRFESTWRSDCYVNILRQYYYKRILGFSDQDVHYALLIREGKLNKQEGIEAIKKEGSMNTDLIKEILENYYNLDFDDIEKQINEKFK